MRAIKDFSQNLNLKEMTIHRANELYKKIEDDGVLKGKSVDAKVAAVIFVVVTEDQLSLALIASTNDIWQANTAVRPQKEVSHSLTEQNF